MDTNPQVEVLTFENCGAHGMNEWVVAQPPLHGCVGNPNYSNTGPGLGPGDYFAKTIAQAYPEDTILLVPAAVPGVSIDTFMRGQSNYENMISRARMAQERGDIYGIIFHQGESDCTQASWPGRVQTVVANLKEDLEIGDVPFLAGEIPERGSGTECSGHNPRVHELPGLITNAHVVEAAQLQKFDEYHFDTAAQRTLGTRYGELMLEVD